MDTTDRIRQANDEAQARFRTMLDAGTLADPNAPETRAYVSAERTMDALIVDAQWERSKAALDALQAADDRSLGDHFVGMPS